MISVVPDFSIWDNAATLTSVPDATLTQGLMSPLLVANDELVVDAGSAIRVFYYKQVSM